jgi:hypothetical protein
VLQCQYARWPYEDDALLVGRSHDGRLKRLAARRHKGNVSALLAELAAREAKFAAAEAYFEEYDVPPLTERAIERMEAEWRGEAAPRRTKMNRKRRPSGKG